MADVMVADRTQSRAEGKVNYYGVHHLALNTDDMKMTVDFYVGVLGMQLVHAMKVPPGLGTGPGNRGNPPFEEIRHYFFDMGRDGLLAFFEMPKGAKQRGDRNALGAMQHVSLAVSPDSQARIRARLDAHKIPYDGPLEILPGIFSIYVFDPERHPLGVQLPAEQRRRRVRASCRRSRRRGSPAGASSLTRDEQWLAAATAGLEGRQKAERRIQLAPKKERSAVPTRSRSAQCSSHVGTARAPGERGKASAAPLPTLRRDSAKLARVTADTSSRPPAGPGSRPSPWELPIAASLRPA